MSDVLPPLANLSRAFQKKDVDFTVIKPLVQGTKATIDSLSMTPGQYFQSLPAIIPELRQYGVHQPSDHEVQNFKANVYDKYLIVLSRHITGRFPDVALLEGFGIFDPVGLSNDLTLHATHGAENLRVLTDHYGRVVVWKPYTSKEKLLLYMPYCTTAKTTVLYFPTTVLYFP